MMYDAYVHKQKPRKASSQVLQRIATTQSKKCQLESLEDKQDRKQEDRHLNTSQAETLKEKDEKNFQKKNCFN